MGRETYFRRSKVQLWVEQSLTQTCGLCKVCSQHHCRSRWSPYCVTHLDTQWCVFFLNVSLSKYIRFLQKPITVFVRISKWKTEHHIRSDRWQHNCLRYSWNYLKKKICCQNSESSQNSVCTYPPQTWFIISLINKTI